MNQGMNQEQYKCILCKLDGIQVKLDSINAHLGALDITAAKHDLPLSDHIRRTELLEARVDPLEIGQQNQEGALKLIMLIVTIAGILGIGFKLYFK